MKALGDLTDQDLKEPRRIDRVSELGNFYRNVAERSAVFAMIFWVVSLGPDSFFAPYKVEIVALFAVGVMFVTINQIRRNYWEPLVVKLIDRDEDLKNRLAWPAGVPVVSRPAGVHSIDAE